LVAANTQQPMGLIAANTVQTPDHTVMNNLVAEVATDSNATAEAWTQKLITQLQSGQSEDEVLAMLAQIHPHDDEPELQDKLSKLIFAAEMFGRLSAQD